MTQRDAHRQARDPDEWASGAEAMTGPQEAYLERLSERAGEPMDYELTKAQASRRIEELRERLEEGAPKRPFRRAPGPPL